VSITAFCAEFSDGQKRQLLRNKTGDLMAKGTPLYRASGTTIAAGVFLSAAILLVSGQAMAQGRPSTPAAPVVANSVPPPSISEDADRVLKQMSTYIGSADQFTFHADVTFDHVMPSGQKLQFSATEDVALQRPNGLYVEWNGGLGNRQFWYDGKTVALYDPDTAFYGSDTAPPAIDAMLDNLINQLNFTPPLVDLMYSNPYKNLRGTLQYGFSTGDTRINGRNCRGFAFVEKHIDWQIWVDTGPQLVPCKLVITYKNNSSMPQFSAVFSDWNFTPRIAASVFTPDLPAGVQKIPFATTTANVGSKQ
jgi:hypothetical protein